MSVNLKIKFKIRSCFKLTLLKVSAHHSFVIGWVPSSLYLALRLVLEVAAVVVETTSHALTTTTLVVTSSLVIVVVSALALILSSATTSTSDASVILVTTSLTTALSPLITVVPLHGL